MSSPLQTAAIAATLPAMPSIAVASSLTPMRSRSPPASQSRGSLSPPAFSLPPYSQRRCRRLMSFPPFPVSSSSFSVPHSNCDSPPLVRLLSIPKERVVTITSAASSMPSSGATTATEDGKVVDLPEALLFDCDGVLVDTERDGHRVSFNAAFEEKGLDVEWGVDLYGELLKIGGGKERMTHYFNQVGWPVGSPEGEGERKQFVADLHKTKTQLFMSMVETGALPLRPGVARLIDEAMGEGVKVAVCSTSNEKAVSAIVREMLGPEKAAAIRIFAGDVVPRKKPDPAIYNLAASELNVDPTRCVVVEDSHIGLQAAKGAGMKCVVTKSGYTADEDFSIADAIFDCIGDAPEERFGLTDLAKL
ncbi:hypothetical protein CBR_g22462 [Chara braunii]|uniref:Uncharacterized protein n=1 Tax=Chara braunii TaxID=69332 RepID=A0A388L2W8_CHABU|nr:hypothetical protein CBR_g22462 [Chara braunii]|eukprot:GBG76582.1 hypothetical protein CBR_g22462 [Chara braunii]